MKVFKNVLVACAAASTFGSGAYLALSGADTIAQQRVEAYMAKTFSRSNEVGRVSNEGQ